VYINEQEQARFIPASPLLVHRICKANLSESKASPIHTRLAKDGLWLLTWPCLNCTAHHSFVQRRSRQNLTGARMVGRMFIMHAPIPPIHIKIAATVRHFQATNRAFCSQDSGDYCRSISSTSSISGVPVWKHCLNPPASALTGVYV
jgi:hypothetical protein